MPIVQGMGLRAVYRNRVRHCSDSEHGQALLRVAIVWLLLLNTAWVAARNPDIGAWVWGINLASAIFSVLLFARIIQRPAPSPRRRVLGAIHDNVAVTAWLYICGPLGALALFVYPFVTVGNGFRFGVRYLAWSGLLGALGIGTLVVAAPGWRSYGLIGTGVLLSHILVTVYTGVLLSRLYRAQAQLATLATCDGLTGLPNRRFFMDQLARQLATPEHRPLACLYMDLDGFKAVNDRCGHQIGDALLQQVAAAVRGCIRAADVLARVGGDEFTVVLDGPTSTAEARVVADRIIATVERITRVADQPVSVSVSIGIACVPADGCEQPVRADDLLKAADDAMYVAKRSGRGRVAERAVAPVLLGATVAGGTGSPRQPVWQRAS